MSSAITDAARLWLDFGLGPQSPLIPRADFEAQWLVGDGAGVSLGLIDGRIVQGCADLHAADIIVRDFVNATDRSDDAGAHGTAMAQLLVGQGQSQMRGLGPRARLFAARVVGPGDSAQPARVAAAIDWLRNQAVDVVAMPIGSEIDSVDIGLAITRGAAAGMRFFAASGCGAGTLLFPARHPLVLAVAPADRDGAPLADARCDPLPDLLAPGWSVEGGAAPKSKFNGSSMACVLAAGVAALALHHHRRTGA